MVEAQLNGFLPTGFNGSLPTFDVRTPPPRPQHHYPPTVIGDGRTYQRGLSSEADFFAENGFILLSHATGVKDWDNVGPEFAGEIEEIIRNRLLPGVRSEIQQPPSPMRRGRGTANPAYAGGIHSDGPLTAELYAANVGAFAGPNAESWWAERYARDDVAGFMSIDFWRTTNMAGPLRHMPLALCAPNSLRPSDFIPMSMIGIAPEDRTSHHLGLCFGTGQRWYFYPEMTSDEVLVFKLCEFWKDRPDAAPQNCFHTAFADPRAPEDAEERQSCEHRVGVLILRD